MALTLNSNITAQIKKILTLGIYLSVSLCSYSATKPIDSNNTQFPIQLIRTLSADQQSATLVVQVPGCSATKQVFKCTRQPQQKRSNKAQQSPKAKRVCQPDLLTKDQSAVFQTTSFNKAGTKATFTIQSLGKGFELATYQCKRVN